MKKTLFLISLGLTVFSIVKSQTVNADFDFGVADACIGQSVQVTNSSNDALHYEWYFCAPFLDNELNDLTTFFSNSNLVFSYGYDILKEKDGIKALGIRNAGIVYRYSYNSDFSTFQGVQALTEIASSNFSLPREIKIVNINENIYGFVTNSGNRVMTRLAFGKSLNNLPTPSDIVLSEPLTQTHGLEIVKNDNKLILFAGKNNLNRIYRIVYDTTDLTSPTSSFFTVPIANDITGISIKKINSRYVGLAVSLASDKLYLLKFNDGILADPEISELTPVGLENPTRVLFEIEQDKAYGFVQLQAGNIIKLDFGSVISSEPAESLINYSGTNVYPIGIVDLNDKKVLYNIDLPVGVSRMNTSVIESDCIFDESPSTELNPVLSFSQSGEFPINLLAFDEEGNFSSITKSLSVAATEAPQGELILNQAYCINDDIGFAFATGYQLTNYLWDFGDSNSSIDADPIHTFAENGEYEITLTIQSSEGCSNTFTQSITIFDEPQPEFQTSRDSYCSFESIAFENLTPGDYGDNISWVWEFNGEGTSTEESPEFSFETIGEKTITLIANVLGCEVNVEKNLLIIEGPQSDFEIDEICLGEPVNFTNLSIENDITGYLWDFGNGENSTDENPNTVYDLPGNYSIQLTATNISGCENIVEKEIHVYDQIIEQISISEAIENLPFSVTANILEESSYEFSSYSWKLGEFNSNAISPDFTIAQVGDYTLSLAIETIGGCVFSDESTFSVNSSSFPFPDFILSKPNICLNEQIELEDSSINSNEYRWFFCPPLLDDNSNIGQTLFSNSSLIFSYGFDFFIENTSIKALGIRNAGIVYRYDFNADLSSFEGVETISEIPTTIFSAPREIKITEFNDNNYAFVTNAGPRAMTRLNFGNSLDNSPTYSDIILNEELTQTHGLEIINVDQESLVIFAGKNNSNRIYRIIYDTNLASPTSDFFALPSASDITGISIKKFNNKFVGLVVSLTSEKLYLIDFNTGILNDPEISEIVLPNLEKPTRVIFETEQSKAYGFVQLQDGNIIKLEFGDVINSSPNQSLISSVGSNVYPLGMIELENKKVLYNIDIPVGAAKLNVFNYFENCSQDPKTINNEATSVFFSEPGTYPITLTATHINGNKSSITKEVNVSSNLAPDIEFQNLTNCIGTPINFESTSDQTLTSYSWSFGDTNTSTDPNPSHTYATAGDYEVTLEVEDGICSNFIKKTITIYDEPVPAFTIPSGKICTNNTYLFQNTTPDDFDGNLTHEWFINGTSASTDKDLNYQFSSGGAKEVKLVATIPGCSVEYIENITNVDEGALVQFNFQDDCVNKAIQFNNTSTGDIVSQEWDFGNGFTSTLVSPSFQYASAGSYDVTLTLTNAAGCVSTQTDQVNIYELPVVAFANDLACEGSPTTFTDQTTIADANIASRSWHFDDPGSDDNTATDTNPSHTFTTSGDFEVKLITTSTNGCKDSIQQVVSVLPAPFADFTYDKLCQGEIVQFEELAEPVEGEELLSWSWDLGGVFSAEQNPQRAFDFAIDYNIGLTVQSENLCTSTVYKTITITPAPEVTFGVDKACDNTATHFYDTTTPQGDAIIGRTWNIAGLASSTDSSFYYTFAEAGIYQIEFSVMTENGCDYFDVQQIEVHEAPIASFKTSISFGAPPLVVSFANSSANANTYEWDFGDGSISTEATPIHTFTELGIYTVQLVAISEQLCKDTVTHSINVLFPDLELELEQLFITEGPQGSNVVLTLKNNGTITIDSMEVSIDFGSQLTAREIIRSRILPGEKVNQTLGVALTNKKLSYVCVEVNAIFAGVDDSEFSNNAKCQNFNDEVVILTPYPNPARDKIYLDIILQNSGPATVELYNTKGELVKSIRDKALSKGFNTIVLDVPDVLQGLYIIKANSGREQSIFKILINN